MSKLISIALILGLVACSKSGGGGASADSCTEAVTKGLDGMMSGRQGPPEMAEQMKVISEKLRSIYVSACQADKWPAEVLNCFAAAKDQPSIKKCREALPPEQAQKIQARIMEVMSNGGAGGPMHGGGGPMGGGAPPAPPAGSATP